MESILIVEKIEEQTTKHKLFAWKKCYDFQIMTSTKATVFSQCPGALQRNALDKPASPIEWL
jgi:hypothetical protein